MPADPDSAPLSPDVIQEAVWDDGGESPATDVEEPSEPAADTGDDGETPPVVKKKTRRGTRGGRNRRKKTAAANAGEPDAEGGVVTAVADGRVEDEPVEHEAPAPEESVDEAAAEVHVDAPEPAETEETAETGYVPMSEWLDDFDRR